jgi:hypothetical protein
MLDRIRYRATSIDGLVQYLATNLFCKGYRYFSLFEIPPGKDPLEIDSRLIGRYRCNLSSQTRAAWNKLGFSVVRYVRLERIAILVARRKTGLFREMEGSNIRDIWRTPLQVGEYSIRYVRQRVSVNMSFAKYKELRAFCDEWACRRDDEFWARFFWNFPVRNYKPVVRIAHRLLKRVNTRRRQAGLILINPDCVRVSRRLVGQCLEPGSVKLIPRKNRVTWRQRQELAKGSETYGAEAAPCEREP